MTKPLSHPDNAFDFVRLAAALAVLYSHSFALFGLPLPSPVAGQSWGSLAVDVFFVVSGYLVCSSWDKDPDFKRFWAKRAARVLPGLWVAVLFTALVVGPFMTSHSLVSYVNDAGTWAYVASNASMIVGRFGLPGVFEHNPFANAANASLWTLRYEMLMYLLLSLVGLVSGKAYLRQGCFGLLLVLLTCWIVRMYVPPKLWPSLPTVAAPLMGWVNAAFEAVGLSFELGDVLGFGMFYFSGSLLYLYRHEVRLHVGMALGLATTLVLVSDTRWLTPLLWLSVPYLTLTLAQRLPACFKKTGGDDLSYGIYIYAFPIQQICSYYFLKFNMGWGWSFSFALVITCVLAKISWRYVEQPALRWKSNTLKINHQP